MNLPIDQSIINWALAGFSMLVGFVLSSIWQAVKDLQKTDKDLVDRVHSVELFISDNYVKKSDLNDVAKQIFDKLDHMDRKLDKKADKVV